MTTVAAGAANTMKKLNTLQVLKLSRTVILAMDALLLIAVVVGAHVHREAMQTVGVDAAPSIVAAQHIKAALADMDADEANEMLAGPNTANSATAGLAQREPEEDAALLLAAGNVTYAAEHGPIDVLQVTGGIYKRLTQETEDLHDGQKDSPDGAASQDVVQAYRATAIIMDNNLLPAADDLDQINDEQLQRTYHQQATDSTLSTVFVVLSGLAALAALLATQVFLSRRMRRTLNPLLFLSTLLALGLTVYTLGALLTEQHQLKVAKEDSFESVHALWRARALAYEANAEESRYLLDPARAGAYESAFVSETNQLVKKPDWMSFDELVKKESAGEHVDGFTGFLADELNNITFKGEQESALRTLAAFGVYMQVDEKIRKLEQTGHDQEAKKVCVGNEIGDSDWAFEQFDRALGGTLAINQQEFERAVGGGLSAVGTLGGKVTLGGLVSTLEFKGVVLSGLIAALVMLGFAPRLKEYD